MKRFNLAVVGATGMVGRTMMKVLEERNFPIENIYFFSSERSAGSEIIFQGITHVVEKLTENSFDRGIDIALFSAGGATSEKFAPIAASKGCVVIDNSSTFRMHDDIPLVVPEVNANDIKWHKGIIANPNCSTIQAVVALSPLHRKYKIKRIVYTTFQAVSGAGMSGYSDLENGVKGMEPQKFSHPIAFNLIPQIDVFLSNGYTKEEMKMVEETRKIMGDINIGVTATCVRVPVYNGHSESINIEFENSFDIDEVTKILKNSPGIIVKDDLLHGDYPMPITASGKDETFIGRIRRDNSVQNGLNIWVVADNIRKGAATNAVQIAEELIKYLK